MNVALLNAWFWPEVRRGSERVVHDLAVDLVALGHRPVLLTSHPGATTRTTEDGFEIVRSRRLPDKPLRMRNIQDALTHLPLSFLELRRGDFDVAHAFYPSDGLAAVEWARRADRPSVFSLMGIPQRNVLANRRLRLATYERVTTRSDAVVVLSAAARDAVWRWLGVESEVIAPGVDLELFAPGGERADEPTFACAADGADDRKRIPLLVEAFGIVRRSVPDARLLLQRPSDPGRARSLGEPEGVELFDLDSKGVVDVFRRAWVSGLASFNEAFGLVLVESMACGTPVFGMRDGGPAEIIDRPEVGTLFGEATPEAVAGAMLGALELARDPATAAACRARAEDFSTMAGARRFEALYERLSAG